MSGKDCIEEQGLTDAEYNLRISEHASIVDKRGGGGMEGGRRVSWQDTV